jgi:hypothetical protein
VASLARRRIRTLLDTGRDGATTAVKGRALEDLVCYVFGKVPGISVTHRNVLNAFDTEEIDVALFNERRTRALDFLPSILLVEAKNWGAPVGSAEVAWFDRKLADRGLDHGILVAVSGVTGNAADKTAAHQIIATSLLAHRRIIVITGDQIDALRDTSALVVLIKERLCELAVSGTVF